MILQSLNKLYSRLSTDPDYDLAPPGFSHRKVSFRVVLKPSGELFAIEDARTINSKGKPINSVTLALGYDRQNGSRIAPNPLCENPAYMLGIEPEVKKTFEAKDLFEGFKKLHLDAEKAVNTPQFSAVCRFLENWDPKNIPDLPLLKELESGSGYFQIQGEKYPIHEQQAVQAWWKETQTQKNLSDPGPTGQCLLTGEVGPIAILHPKIKGVKDTQSTGAVLIAFDKPPFESYAKKKDQGLNAPISETAAHQYGSALNCLLTGPQSHKHRFTLANNTIVFWTEEKTSAEDLLADIFSTPPKEESQNTGKLDAIKKLLESIRLGVTPNDLGKEETPFYMLGLAPNAARISIRFFHRSTLGHLLKNLKSHLENMEIQGGKPYTPLWQILQQSSKVPNDISPLLGGGLTQAILEGTPYPHALYTAVLRRVKIDQRKKGEPDPLNPIRIGILKATLTRNYKTHITPMLDPKNTAESYLLGRLFACLEKTQEDALGKINKTIRDTYFGSACSTPASVFPRILRTYNHHLNKLEMGQKVHRDKLVQEIYSHLKAQSLPSHLSLPEQGLFSVGYYHQRNAFFTKKTETQETK
jgi:CRISPR-associated protein Csd1